MTNQKVGIAMVSMAMALGSGLAQGEARAQLMPRDAKTFFEILNKDNMDLVDDFYAKDVHFIDPVVEFHDRDELRHYYQSAYDSTESVTFEIPSVIEQGNEQSVIWVMTMISKKLNKGKPVIVRGSSHIRYNDQGKAIYHRDYFDMGEMVYYHVPFIRGMVKFVDRRMRKKHDATY